MVKKREREGERFEARFVFKILSNSFFVSDVSQYIGRSVRKAEVKQLSKSLRSESYFIRGGLRAERIRPARPHVYASSRAGRSSPSGILPVFSTV